MDLRRFMFEHVYTNPIAKHEEIKVERIISALYSYLTEHPEELSSEFRRMLAAGEPVERAVCDYISGMTDQYCIHRFQEIYVPKSWDVL